MSEEETKNSESPTIHIEYYPASFHRRVLADVIDFLIFILIGMLFFVGIRDIVVSSSSYKESQATIKNIKTASGLYEEKDGEAKDIVTIYSSDSDLTKKELMDKYSSAIDFFVSYLKTDVSQEASEAVTKDYDSYRLSSSFAYEGEAYFVSDGGKVIANPSCKATYQMYAENVYAPYLTGEAVSFLTKYSKPYGAALKYQSDMLLFLEIPLAYFLGDIFAFFLPPLFLKRGRKTIGKLIYHIGRVNENCLSLTLKEYIGESAIFCLAVVLLSLVTLGIPLIISFSLMAFSKHRQDFADYMLGIREVETDRQKIFFSETEAISSSLTNHLKSEDFKPDDLKDK